MKSIEQLYEQMEKLLDTIGIPKEPPKGSFYDLSSDEEQGKDKNETPKRKSGGQPGNQNTRKHGLYSKHLPARQLEEYDNALRVRDLAPEIAIVRVRLNELLKDPEADPNLVNRTMNVLSRLMSIQRRYIYG